MELKKERLNWIDSLRALAVFLVCLGHVLAYFKSSNIYIYIYDITYVPIYLFHMPLFFMLSGVTYEISIKRKTKKLIDIIRKRIINLFVPTVFILIVSFIFNKGITIFGCYNKVWFLIFLMMIILLEGIIDNNLLIKCKEFRKIAVFSAAAIWFIFGIFQLMLLYYEMPGFAKYICEISKFAGYFICYFCGRWMIRSKEKVMKMDFKFWIMFLFSIIMIILCTLLKTGDNIALARIICGIPTSAVLIILFYQNKKNCSKAERLISTYSLEIYLIHVNIIHAIFLPLLSLQFENLKNSFVFGFILLLADMIIPTFIGCFEKYVPFLKFIFHPIK